MKFRAVGLMLAVSAVLSGCGESEAEKAAALMNPKEDGNYVLISSNVKRPPVVYRVIQNGKRVINLEAEWLGPIKTGVVGIKSVLTEASCGQIIITEVDGRMRLDVMSGSLRRKGYEDCGLGDIPFASWQFRTDTTTE